MSTYELSGWEDDEIHSSLVCLYSNWPDYRIAHFLNATFDFHFENKEEGYPVERRGVSGLISFFISTQSDIHTTYLIGNKCFTSSSQSGVGLFSNVNFINPLLFIKSLSKCPYLLLNTSTKPNTGWNPLVNNKNISNYIVDLQTLNRTEQNLINEFIHAE